MMQKKGKYVLSEKVGENIWPNEIYYQSQIDATEMRRFGNVSLQCPGNPEKYLNETYGSNWSSCGSTHFFNHKKGTLFRSSQFDLVEDMFVPALPFE